MVFDWDDFGANHVISGMCQSHDCRDKLDQLHFANPAFKATLFAIPGEMTPEMLNWCNANQSWIELAVHGFFHRDNYECENMSYEDFELNMASLDDIIGPYFVKGFKAPGWQISDDIYQWLNDHGWWVADQGYNFHRRPPELPAYVNNNGSFTAIRRPGDIEEISAWHGHTWDCCGNGIYETFDHVKALVENTKEFKFVSEVL